MPAEHIGTSLALPDTYKHHLTLSVPAPSEWRRYASVSCSGSVGAAPAKVSEGRPFSGGRRFVFSELAAAPSRSGYVDSYTGFEKLVGCPEGEG